MQEREYREIIPGTGGGEDRKVIAIAETVPFASGLRRAYFFLLKGRGQLAGRTRTWGGICQVFFKEFKNFVKYHNAKMWGIGTWSFEKPVLSAAERSIGSREAFVAARIEIRNLLTDYALMPGMSGNTMVESPRIASCLWHSRISVLRLDLSNRQEVTHSLIQE